MINLTEELLFLKTGDDLVKALSFAFSLTIDLERERKANSDLWGFGIIFGRRGNDFPYPEEFLNILLGFCVEARRRSDRAYELQLTQYLGLESLGEGNLRNSFRTGCRVLLLYLYKLQALLLPYAFTRPLGYWIDNFEGEVDCFTPLVRSFLEINTFNIVEEGSRYSINSAQKKAKRLRDIAIKIVLASSWKYPEDIAFDDLLEWRDKRDEFTWPSGRRKISSIPFLQIIEHVGRVFPGRLNFDVSTVKNIIRPGKRTLSPKAGRELITKIFSDRPSSLSLFSKLKGKGLLLHMTRYASPDLRVTNLEELLGSMRGEFCQSFKVWLELEDDYLSTCKYEDESPWLTVFGRLNVYLLIFLPLWFDENNPSDYEYPSSPSKFLGYVYYRTKSMSSVARPPTFLEFSNALGYSCAYPVTNNLKLFFEWLILHRPDHPGCIRLVQPIYIQEKTKKRKHTTKNILEGKVEILNAEFLLSLFSISSHIDDNPEMYWRSIEDCKRLKCFLSFNSLGYIPYVYIDGVAVPILELDHRCLIFALWNGNVYFNPASFIFPFVMQRGGLRGQNLQWLDSRSYDSHARRRVDEFYGVDVLYINTDKLYEQPFTVFCRSIVISLLDVQNLWRKRMVEVNGCAALDYEVSYEGRSLSKWDKVQCLFAQDTESGYPLTDHQYNRIHRFAALSFQVWLKSLVPGMQVVAYIPIPAKGKKYYEWDEWVGKENKHDLAKVSQINGVDYTPVSLRVRVTPHGSRATFLTELLKHESAEIVSKATGQTPRSAAYYNRGDLSLIERMSGAYNFKDPLKVATPFAEFSSSADLVVELLASKKAGRLNGFVSAHGLTTIYGVGDGRDRGEYDGLRLISTDISNSLLACSTHICLYGFICPDYIVAMQGGANRCSICSVAIFSTHFIYAVSAKRHQLAEELISLQRKIADIKGYRDFDMGDIATLEQELKIAAEDLLGWYLVERSLDVMIRDKADKKSSGKYLNLGARINDPLMHENVASSEVSNFLLRLQQVCEFPQFISDDFKFKVSRTIRLMLAQKGDVYNAVMSPLPSNPQVYLASIIRQQMDLNAIDLDALVSLINMSDSDWHEYLAVKRSIQISGIGAVDEVFKGQ